MSAAGAIGMFLGNIGIGFLAGALGYVVDFINGQSAFYNLSHQTLNTMNMLTWMLWIFAFVYLLASVFNLIVTSINESGGYA
jgi:hypothetical protein